MVGLLFTYYSLMLKQLASAAHSVPGNHASLLCKDMERIPIGIPSIEHSSIGPLVPYTSES